MVRLTSVLGLLLLATSCRNDCQDICNELADYAGDCDIPVATSEVNECISNHQRRDLEDGDLEICGDFKSSETIREEWTCTDLAEYWADAAR